MIAPICLFSYNRLAELKLTVDALTKNYLASESDLFVFSDGAKDGSPDDKVVEVRKYLKTIKGFKSVTIFESPENRGLANSIIDGVTKIVQRYGRVIVVEDDLVSTPNFLNFMNQALDFYSGNKQIFSISGYTLDLPSLNRYKKDFYLGHRPSSWGWATWEDRWMKVDWQANNYRHIVYNPIKHIKFMRGGSDLPFMLWKQINGKIDSWAIRWSCFQFIHNLLTVFPSTSKIENVGFGPRATHTKHTGRFETSLDSELKENFVFSEDLTLQTQLLNEFRNKFSFGNRLKNRLKHL
ncbi:glycosyltransferase [Sunxiuqinia indica]|uniref:glycosyltransferase n=1 Tax=Sunxiuqinia indica TaxID=2692584 RepID=UPI00135B97A7|nr:glycosyltransferase [Sunxiuqinia indica]